MRLLLPFVVLMLLGCSGSVTNRNPVGETLPRLEGTGLNGKQWTFPEGLEGEPAVLFVGYVQDSQFDIDRWLLGMLQLKTDVAVYEVPTIEGMIPGMIAGRIDEGMRKGIPAEDWASVVTVYDDAEYLVKLTGNENPRNARVMLIGRDEKIIWFWDQGYSASAVASLDEAVTKSKLGSTAIKPTTGQ